MNPERLLATLLALLLAGCATLPANPTEMTPEALKEWVKDKNANISCGRADTPYGRVVGIYVVLDKGIIFDGAITVDAECKVTITTTSPKK